MKSLSLGIILFFIFGLMFASQNLLESNLKNNETFDIYNFTENELVWNYTQEKNNIEYEFTEYTKLNYSQIQSKRINNIIDKSIDFIGFMLFEIAKWSMEFGYTHPEYNFGYFMNFVKYWLFAMIIIACFPIIVPLIALIYLLIIGIKNIYLSIGNKWRNRKLNK